MPKDKKTLRTVLDKYIMERNEQGGRHGSQDAAFAEILKRILEKDKLLDIMVEPTPDYLASLSNVVHAMRASKFGGYDHEQSFISLSDVKNQPPELVQFIKSAGGVQHKGDKTVAPAKPLSISIVKVHAHSGTKPIPSQASSVQLNCPAHILNEFRNIIAATALPGSSFTNPYTGKQEIFPAKASDFTARHLQIIARNEPVNTDGIMKTSLYQGLLTDDQIARVRCLVKATTVAGITQATAYGGYYSKKQNFDQKVIVVDQAGLQWQGDFRNTGGMFFYPDNPNDGSLPKNYSEWQKDMYKNMYGEIRPSTSSPNHMTVTWKGVKGRIDLDQVALGIEREFMQALDAAVSQGNTGLGPDEKINFKFLKAGMGFFADGLKDCNRVNLEMARLRGIEQALQRIANLPESEREAALGKVKRLELPFSSNPPASDPIIARIEILAKGLKLEWGGTPNEDAFKPRHGFVNATTNCADPHAMIGNEGGYSSVDAAISSNANLEFFNPAYNEKMQLRTSLLFDKGITLPLEKPIPPQVKEVEAIQDKHAIISKSEELAALFSVTRVISKVQNYLPDNPHHNKMQALDTIQFEFASKDDRNFFEKIIKQIDPKAVQFSGKGYGNQNIIQIKPEFIVKAQLEQVKSLIGEKAPKIVEIPRKGNASEELAEEKAQSVLDTLLKGLSSFVEGISNAIKYAFNYCLGSQQEEEHKKEHQGPK